MRDAVSASSVGSPWRLTRSASPATRERRARWSASEAVSSSSIVSPPRNHVSTSSYTGEPAPASPVSSSYPSGKCSEKAGGESLAHQHPRDRSDALALPVVHQLDLPGHRRRRRVEICRPGGGSPGTGEQLAARRSRGRSRRGRWRAGRSRRRPGPRTPTPGPRRRPGRSLHAARWVREPRQRPRLCPSTPRPR